mmetsp:Transcript_4774/g.7111  ORF Transcript_4774/g.7111 Transcript_4774/m.7111 type:complete len:86 (-) Transcript_4774:131-388(-)
MFKVRLCISFRIGDIEHSLDVVDMLKEGSIYDKNQNICHTDVFVADVEKFRTFLNIKAQLVKDVWSGNTKPNSSLAKEEYTIKAQ